MDIESSNSVSSVLPVRSALCDGVMLSTIFDDTHKTDILFVNFILPLNETNASAASLLSKMLLRGTALHPDTVSLSRACDDNYSTAPDAFTVKQGETICLSLSVSSLKNRFAPNGEDILAGAFALLAEIIYSPLIVDGAFREDYFARERKVLGEQIESLINNKPAYASRRAVDIMCKGEAYATASYGTAAALGTFTAASLAKIYTGIITNASVEILFAGSASHDEVKSLLNATFRLTPRPYLIPVTVRTDSAEALREITEDAAAEQSTLIMGFRTGDVTDKLYAAFTLFTGILSLSPVSKLFMNVREKLSLCYYCSSVADRQKGVMLISTGIDAKNAVRARDAVLEQIKDIQSGNFTDSEFDSALRFSANGYDEMGDRPGALCSFWFSHILGGRYRSPDEEKRSLYTVTREQITEAAKLLSADTFFLLKGTTDDNGNDDQTY